ncbi:DUF1573 domain-containing protein [Flavobacterium amnicola]|uniref:DUF1573 domain-containing protein n=1 Tax=Flavobacterium amnicola TaxID=2506422 RepID=A0A4Q1K603_9FLAO|nr:DUF1573 domain-containing protein [Flavobacterium amnicola]RXR21238.1 DUF1573 domain-containing protein [Flavobacterium amnicola]
MKKIILMAAAIAFFGNLDASAQEIAKNTKKVKKAKTTKVASKKEEAPKFEMVKVAGPAMTFESETVDYGTIEQGADGQRQFTIINNGTEPLVISNAVGSCGCTVPTFPKEPIAPGAKAVIGVKYDTNRVGAFTKSVTITSNAKDLPTKVVTIKGTVNAKAAPVSPLTPAAPAGPVVDMPKS